MTLNSSVPALPEPVFLCGAAGRAAVSSSLEVVNRVRELVWDSIRWT